MKQHHTEAQLITTELAAEKLFLSPRTMIRWRELRKGPAYVKAGRRVLYRVSDIDAWLERHKAEMVGEV